MTMRFARWYVISAVRKHSQHLRSHCCVANLSGWFQVRGWAYGPLTRQRNAARCNFLLAFCVSVVVPRLIHPIYKL